MIKKKSFLLISSILGGTGGLVTPVVWADCTNPAGATVTCSNSVTTQQFFNTSGQDITITQGTQFITSGGSSSIYFGSQDAALLNNGNITADTDGIRFFSTGNSKVTNNGTITSSGTQTNAIHLVEVFSSSVNNTGTLTTAGNGSYGIFADTVKQLSIKNTGNITTSGAGADGIHGHDMDTGLVSNEGKITVNGAGSIGIALEAQVKKTVLQNLDSGVIYAPQGIGVSLTDTASIDTLWNSGVIDGGDAGISLGGTSQTGMLVNSGYILGGGNGNGVVLTDSSRVNQFDNRGLIGALTGDAIQVGSSSTVVSGINNQGIIVGRVNAPGTNLSNSGILELLSNQQSSTVNNYVQGSTGVLALQADNISSYGQITVAGNASLEGRTFVITRGSTGFTNGDELVDVVTASSITGTPSSVMDDSLRYQFLQEQTGTSYSLKIVDTNLTTVKNTITTTSNNTSLAGVGTVLDTLITNSANNSPIQTTRCNGALASTVCAITSSFNAKQIHNNVVQLAPLMDGSMPYIEMNNLRAFGDIVGNRQESVRGQGYTNDFNPEKYLWIRPVGRWDNQSSRGDYTGYNADTRGIAIGADGLVFDRTRLGVALGMSRTDVNDNSSNIRQDARVDSWNLLAYGGFDFTPNTGMTWQTGFGRNNTTGNRYLNIKNPADGSTAYSGTARSDYDSDTFQAGLGLQSTFHPLGDAILTPELRTDYYRITDKRYQESGADDVGLKVDGTTTEALVVSSKLKAGIKLSEIVDVHGYVGAGYDTMNNRSKTTAAFIGSADTPFTYHGMSESPWIAMAGVGVTAKFSDVLDGTVQYDADQRTKFTSQSVSLKVRYAF